MTEPFAPQPDEMSRWASVFPERLCPAFAQRMMQGPVEQVTMLDRDEHAWAGWRIDLSSITAATLNVTGYKDRLPDSAHGFQNNYTWAALDDGPQRQIEGGWPHDWPYSPGDYPYGDEADRELNPAWALSDFTEIVLQWFDYWLKGVGPPPDRLGTVDYKDHLTGEWHEATAWPPTEAEEQVLSLAGGAITGVETEAPDASFIAVRGNDHRSGPLSGLCVPDLSGGLVPALSGAPFVSEPMGSPVRIAGNPFVSLDVTSDEAAGAFNVFLLALSADFTCGVSGPTGVTQLAAGGIDLRFRDGTMVGVDFPVGTPTTVRIDVEHVAATLQTGWRLAVVVQAGGGYGFSLSTPRIDVSSESELILPVVEGMLSERIAAPGDYPPSPIAY